MLRGMEPMHLPDVEAHEGSGAYADAIRAAKGAGMPMPQIWHLFAFKPHATQHLAQFTQEILRGDAPLSAGFRELIAAFTSRRNQCLF